MTRNVTSKTMNKWIIENCWSNVNSACKKVLNRHHIVHSLNLRPFRRAESASSLPSDNQKNQNSLMIARETKFFLVLRFLFSNFGIILFFFFNFLTAFRSVQYQGTEDVYIYNFLPKGPAWSLRSYNQCESL